MQSLMHISISMCISGAFFILARSLLLLPAILRHRSFHTKFISILYFLSNAVTTVLAFAMFVPFILLNCTVRLSQYSSFGPRYSSPCATHKRTSCCLSPSVSLALVSATATEGSAPGGAVNIPRNGTMSDSTGAPDTHSSGCGEQSTWSTPGVQITLGARPTAS